MEHEFMELLKAAFDPGRTVEEACEAFKRARAMAVDDAEGWWVLLHPRLRQRPSLTYMPTHAFAHDLPTTLPFRKYKDQPIADVARRDPSYLNWCLTNVNMTDSLREAIQLSLQSL